MLLHYFSTDGSKTVEVKLTVVELKECKNELISYKRNIKNITTYIHACYMLYQLEKLSTIQVTLRVCNVLLTILAATVILHV